MYCVSTHCILLYLHSIESPDPIVFNALGSGVLSTMSIVRVLFVKESSDVRGTRTRPWRRVPAPAGVAAAAAWLSPPAYEGARRGRGGGEAAGRRGGGAEPVGKPETTTRVVVTRAGRLTPKNIERVRVEWRRAPDDGDARKIDRRGRRRARPPQAHPHP